MRRSLVSLAVPLVLAASQLGAQAAPPAPPSPPAPLTPPAPAAPGTVPTAAPTPPPAPAAPAAPAAAVTAADVDVAAVLKTGRYVSTWANFGSVDSLLTIADPGLGDGAALRERLTGGLNSFAEQLGAETKMVEERVVIVNNTVQYWRTAEFSGVPVPLVFRVTMGRGGTWRGFTVTPNEQLPQQFEVVKQP